MKRLAHTTVLALVALCLPLVGCTRLDINRPIRVQDYTETIRVACVGDSITYGAGIENRLRDCYPAQLGRMLGEKWQIRNFGVSGATMLKKGDKPYWKEQAFQDALTYAPHVVVIKLGTNDTKPQNWKFKSDFVRDYTEMIEGFKTVSSKPRIWICWPVPAYPERWGISDVRIKNEVIPLVTRIARQEGVPIIDLYEPLSNKPELFPDLIHPNAEAARLIAREVYAALTGNKAPNDAKACTLPKVLIIGDSISIGYFEPTRQLLEGKALAYHNPGNAQHTANGLAKLDTWLGTTKWDVIHFNFGLHDIKYVDQAGKAIPVDKGTQQIPIDQYEKNLDQLAGKLKKTGAKLIFATTTPVPQGAASRVKGDTDRYNTVAKRIMKRHGFAINDLYQFALPRLDEIQRKQNVHFHEEGSRLLAEQVAAGILKALEGP